VASRSEASKAQRREYQREYARRNPDRKRAWSRNSHLRRTYGLEPTDYEEMLTAQGGVCAICEGEPGDRPLDVDHDHSTGQVRGLLCHKCNKALGLLNDNVDAAQRYLEAHGAAVI
jgi:hypothetical protein